MDTVTLTINGNEIKANSNSTILEAALGADIYIPSLCYYPELKPLPEIEPDIACKLCLVEADGKLVLSCMTKATDGMVVETNTSTVEELRRRYLLGILRRHPTERITGELQKAVDHIGLETPIPYIPKKLPIREDSPFFLRDNNLCIRCERCVRVCDDIRGLGVIEFAFPCHKACPAGIDIPRYISLIGQGRPAAALGVIREKVPFPGALGRVCIHPCETACQRGQEIDKPLNIRMLKRFAADNGGESWKDLSKKLPPTGKSVAVVGAGPAGLTAAYYLAKLGHKVTVFESLPEPGGMMRVGIPEYRLPRDILSEEINVIRDAGVEIKLSTKIESLDALFKDGYNAIFLGVGAHQGMSLGVEGDDLPGVIESADFLRRSNLGETVDVGARVAVVGGGNVAIDSARMSLRLGAKQVTVFYRRTRNEMPAAEEEVEAAIEEGIEFNFLTAPSRVTRNGSILKLECIRMELGEPDASGRARPVPIEGSEYVSELDTVIAAIGQRPQIPEDFQVELGRGNTIKADDNMKSSREGVFSAGDCVTGPASVIGAIAGGRTAAEAIDRYLGGAGDIAESLVPMEETKVWPAESLPEERLATFSHLPAETRKHSFDEVELGMDRDTAMMEAQRCLRCHVISPMEDKVLEDAGCKFCGACVDSCPTGALIERTAVEAVEPDRIVTTICPYCGVGCQLKLEIKDERIVRSIPDPKGPANKGQACVKGKFGLEFVHDPNRLKKPLIKRNGTFVETSWDVALDLVANKLGQYNGNEIAVISSAKCTNEENYLIQKFARGVLGTNNVDHCARL